MLKLRNTTNQEIILCDTLFRESGSNDDTHTIPSANLNKWANDDGVLQNLANGNVILSLNDKDITSVNEAVNTLKEVLFNKKSPRTQRPEVTAIEPEGDFDSIVSHDLTDPTTWFQESVRKIGVTLTEDNGVYKSSFEDWIDLTHGKHPKEDDLAADHPVVVYDDGVALTEDVDFTVDYKQGFVVFNGYTPTGDVTADFSHRDSDQPGNSRFKLEPKPNTLLKVRLAEVDFTVDAVMQPVVFEILGYDPTGVAAPPEKVVYDRIVYKNERDILKIGNDIQQIAKWGSLQNDVKRVVFAYGRSIDLSSSAGMELRVSTQEDKPFVGELSSVSFYVAYEDEE